MNPPFEQIVDRHGPAVLRICRAVVGHSDAEDAWAETFLAAMRAYPDLAADARVEAWLLTIAYRKAVDILRVRAREAIPMAELPERVEVGGAAFAPGTGVAFTTDLSVWEDVRALPDKQRQTIAYHYLVGLPFAEIAAILGGSEAAARRAAADGMKRLRAQLVVERDAGLAPVLAKGDSIQ